MFVIVYKFIIPISSNSGKIEQLQKYWFMVTALYNFNFKTLRERKIPLFWFIDHGFEIRYFDHLNLYPLFYAVPESYEIFIDSLTSESEWAI